MKMIKSSSLLFVMFFVALFTYAQKGPTLDSKLLEVWEPVPAKITPGENNAPPSDAIILFDGKDLNEWTNQKGGLAEWIVEDG
ncbi:MAG: DUF1080 domain-containing protein, partial [Cyclobacteriaceae bacterium]|nr:DUF1080 domain-containing protein [Cyclobacteriaceae bacterium]